MTKLQLSIPEWSRIGPAEDDRLAGYSFGDNVLARTQAQLLTALKRIDVREYRDGLAIQTFSYVGRVQLGDLEISIQPKIEGLQLVRLLRYAYGLRDLELHPQHTQATGDSDFLDLIIWQLLIEVEELMLRGLQRNYHRVREPLASPRGRIDFQQFALRGGAAEATLPCVHHPRLQNTLLNRVILSGLLRAVAMTTSLDLRTGLRRLAARMSDEITPVNLTWEVMNQVRRDMDRRVKSYQPALNLIALLMQMGGVLLEDAKQTRLPGFLFDMNRFFQTLLSRFFHEHLKGYLVRDEHQLRDMMAYLPGHNPCRRRSPTPRPDYAIVQDGRIKAILDAKYIDLWQKTPPRSILYQVAMYALSQGRGSSAIVLYPTTLPSVTEAIIEVREIVGGTAQALIVLRPVHLSMLEQLLSAGSSQDAQAAREELAHALVFGPATAISTDSLPSSIFDTGQKTNLQTV